MYKLRPHHGLCTAFFCGHGYSAAFTENMTKKIAVFSRDNPLIQITTGADCICECCPHNLPYGCDASEKVFQYDRAVLRQCALAESDILHWHDFCQLVDMHILSCGKLAQICGDCAWFSLCEKQCARHDFS